MLAVVMFVGIITTVLALSYSTLMRFEQISRVRHTWGLLESIYMATSQIAPAPAGTYPVFRQRLFTNPGQISQLIGPVDSNDDTNYPDACGFGFNNSQRNASRQWEPFLARAFDPAIGLASPMGIINNSFVRVLISGQYYLMVVINQADLSDITMLDGYDNDDGATLGKVRWDTIAGSIARLTYMITADNNC